MKKILLIILINLSFLVSGCVELPRESKETLISKELAKIKSGIIDRGDYLMYKYGILGLTENGKMKEKIIFPNLLNFSNEDLYTTLGYTFFTYQNFLTNYYTIYAEIESNNLKVVYLNSNRNGYPYNGGGGTTYYNCPNLKEIFIPNGYVCFKTNDDYEEIVNQSYDSDFLCFGTDYRYVNEVLLNFSGKYYISNEAFVNQKVYGEEEKYLVSYESYNDYVHNDGQIRVVANVSYYFFTNNSSSYVYFVDDCDGEKITNIPAPPLSVGYIFDGWYKEPECINKWDFENDVVPFKVYDEEGNYIYKETKLYGRWIEE